MELKEPVQRGSERCRVSHFVAGPFQDVPAFCYCLGPAGEKEGSHRALPTCPGPALSVLQPACWVLEPRWSLWELRGPGERSE